MNMTYLIRGGHQNKIVLAEVCPGFSGHKKGHIFFTTIRLFCKKLICLVPLCSLIFSCSFQKINELQYFPWNNCALLCRIQRSYLHPYETSYRFTPVLKRKFDHSSKRPCKHNENTKSKGCTFLQYLQVQCKALIWFQNLAQLWMVYFY